MGQALASVKRFVRNFDVEHRAMKYIEKSSKRAVAAPKHPGTPPIQLSHGQLEDLFSHNPELDRRVDKFDITSAPVKDGILPESVNYVKESKRRLPQKVYGQDPFPEPHIDFGFIVPDSVPKGRLTMRQAVNLIKAYQTKQSTIEELALSNNMDRRNVEAIVEHFMLFTVPSAQFWMPPSLLSDIAEKQNLLDQPVETTDSDEPLGGSIHEKRRSALLGLPSE
ncbi:hypothetical protein CRM22_000880 [Opisthorchis felineus]|uniref:NADH dehydrogenase [ubiquinone] 1 alpha subcomplex assembly factor 4 n=1 Tax=Opisthorchis felineus TaxID=147828 RepID=A0A4S2MD32_OPIFE|nr:hypothetical protein CRM22_000880 [Opisthorchis felineus]